ncbi:uncharacterized protein MONOS_17620 [Monocercomonoides exilis]|uniref:uncharacterized protein n=1 Tax=Monocercomonoides exilis TaxID=2049356 RepID=UPI00355978EB|nr:hypothetical protein MONOS_17620 [Monocercomonoides exilis]
MKKLAWNNKEKRRMMIEEHKREIMQREEKEKAKNAEKPNTSKIIITAHPFADVSQKSQTIISHVDELVSVMKQYLILFYKICGTGDGEVDWRVIKSDKEVEEVQERADRTGKGKTSCGAEEAE